VTIESGANTTALHQAASAVHINLRHVDAQHVGVSLDETPDRAWRSVRRHGLTFPVIHDAGNVLAGRLRVTELPISFVIDGGGHVRWVGGPEQARDALERTVAALSP